MVSIFHYRRSGVHVHGRRRGEAPASLHQDSVQDGLRPVWHLFHWRFSCSRYCLRFLLARAGQSHNRKNISIRCCCISLCDRHAAFEHFRFAGHRQCVSSLRSYRRDFANANARLMLTSIFSAGNTYTYCAVRNLYGLALEGRAPRFLAYTTKKGVPLYCFCVVMLFPFLAFLSCSNGSEQALKWLINITTAGGKIAAYSSTS